MIGIITGWSFKETARGGMIHRMTREHKDKCVVFEGGAYILYQLGDVGYGAMDWCFVDCVKYKSGDEESKEKAEKKAEKFLGVPLW